MGAALSIREMVDLIHDADTAITRASRKALLKVTLQAELKAKQNASQQFTGRHGRTLSGGLNNAIYSGFERESDEELSGFVGTHGIPYGRVQEYGSDGPITPKQAKHLWVKNYRVGPQFKRITPREFMAARLRDPRHWPIFRSKNDKLIAWHSDSITSATKSDVTALFFLMDQVTIPARPYLGPAMEEASENFSEEFARFYAQELFG